MNWCLIETYSSMSSLNAFVLGVCIVVHSCSCLDGLLVVLLISLRGYLDSKDCLIVLGWNCLIDLG